MAGALAAATAGVAIRAQPRRVASLADFGGVGDGRADNAEALRRALAAAGPGGAVHVPAGRFRIVDRSILEGKTPFVVPAGLTLSGEGARSVLRFERERFPSFYGLTVSNDGAHLRDLALEVDTAGSGWTAAVGIVEAIKGLRFTNVAFTGVGSRAGHHGVLPIGADIDDLTMSNCRFERLDFGFTRETSDPAVYRRLLFEDCAAEDCTEVFEINAPGVGFVNAEAGSDVVDRLVDHDGHPLDPTRLRIGQAVRSPVLPAGTTVVGHASSGQIRLSKRALANARGGNPARLSAGGASGGVIRNLRVRNIGQWAVGLANCTDWSVDVQGEDVGYELVHIEDGSSNIRVAAGGSRCNLNPGVVGSAGADNGMVSISTGSHDVSVHFAVADLTGSTSGRPAALAVQAGGPMGTTGREVEPQRVSVGGTVLMRAGAIGVIAFDSGVHFDGLTLINPDPASRADPMLRLPGCRISGTVRVRNPGRTLIREEPNRPIGSFERVETF